MFDYSSRVLAQLSGAEKTSVMDLLQSQELDFEEGADCIVLVEDMNDNLAATASLFGNVIRMVAVNPLHQESGLSAIAISNLVENARARGISHLFVYTKPDMAIRFASLGFRNIAETADVSLLEMGEPGIGLYKQYLSEIRLKAAEGDIVGAAVMNCNPFTKGHRYLAEQMAEACDVAYIIVVETNLSAFSFEDRLEMVRLGTMDLKNIQVLRSAQYAVSSATFPTYFLKEKGVLSLAKQQAALDINLFARLFVPALSLNARFVGSEPESAVTAIYNETMKEVLPSSGVALYEIERRLSSSGNVISASTVRNMLETGRTSQIYEYIPDTTAAYLTDRLGYQL